METTSFSCGFASSFLGAERPTALKTMFSSSLSFCRLAVVPASRWGLRVAACAVSNKPMGKPRGIMRPRKVSPAMQELIGVPEISGKESLKLIYAHIKQNNLHCFKGIESFSNLEDSIYFEAGGSVTELYVIQFIASSLNWKSGKIALTQEVNNVDSSDQRLRVTLTVSTREGSGTSTFNVRIPYWTINFKRSKLYSQQRYVSVAKTR